MKLLPHSVMMLLIMLAAMRPLDSWGSTPMATGLAESTPKALMISASVGPLHYLSGAKVVVKDARGKIIGRAVTNNRGASLVKLRPDSRAELPFRITATGGRILDSHSSGIKGARFQGGLRAKLMNLDADGGTHVYLDLVSTLASRLESRKQDYPSAFAKVRGALGIKSPVSPKVLRFQNNHAGWAEIESEIKQKKSFGAFVQSLENKIKRGESLAYLKPGSDRLKQPNSGTAALLETALTTGGMARITASSSSYSPCNSQLGDTSANGGSSSTELITAVGVEASKGLLSMAGLKALEPAVDIAAGMLLTGGNVKSPEQQALEQVAEQLECISAQINYLSGQIDQLMVYETVSPALECDSSVETSYDGYEFWVDMAYNGSVQLNNSNQLFMNDLATWEGMESCGSAINKMLWGTSGGQGSAWQAINKQYYDAYPWWTQQQVQELQEFLSYWSLRTHQAFVLQTEYLNYYGYDKYGNPVGFEKAKAMAGAYENPTGELSAEVCTTDSTYYPNTFCVWQNKIPPAYPKDLYSDEVAIPTNGLAVHVLPGSYDSPSSDGGIWWPVDAKYIVQTYGRRDEDKKVFATDFDGIPNSYEQNFTISPENGGSAVENYRNLKARHATVTREQVGALNQPGPSGPWVPQGAQSTVNWFFSSQITSVENNPWWTATGLTFYAKEDVSWVTSITAISDGGASAGYSFEPRSSVLPAAEFVAAYDCPGDQKNRFNCSYYEPHFIGTLLQRNWWNATSALTYKPPCPPLPEGQQC